MTAATRPYQPRSETHSIVANGLADTPGNGRNSGKDHVVGYTMIGTSGTRSPVTPTHQSLDANVTPRSGSRKHRAEVTPPSQSPLWSGGSIPVALSTAGKRAEYGNGYKSPEPVKKQRSISVSSDDADIGPRVFASHERSDTSMSAPMAHVSSKFFYASDVAPVKSPPSRDAKPGPKPWVGDYNANRKDVRVNGLSQYGDEALSKPISPPQNDPKSQFFYANDVPDSRPSSSRANLHSPPPRPPLQTIHSGHSPQMYGSYRPPSPLKEEIFVDDESDDEALNDTAPAPPNGDNLSRSSSRASGSPRNSNHKRKSSVPTTNGRQRKSSIPQPITENQNTPNTNGITSPKRASIQDIDSRNSKEQIRSPEPMSQPQSPTKPKKEIDRMNELAAKARRDRKVLDLEISNSSLLAINSTLEREMRKMKSDLRHYRRLSRNGKTSSEHFQRLPRDSGCAPDELSSSESENEDEASSTFSTSQKSATGNRAALSRFDDPKIEPLDLNAYRAMILESRQLNQTIKHCLGQSEVMLKSGQEALEFHSQTIDVESLGPRVLSPDEIGNDVLERRQGLLTPTLSADRQSNNPWERSLANYSQREPPSRSRPNLEALAKLNNTHAPIDRAPEAEVDRSNSTSPVSDRSADLPEVPVSCTKRSSRESLLPAESGSVHSIVKPDSPVEAAVEDVFNGFTKTDIDGQAALVRPSSRSIESIDPTLVEETHDTETVGQTGDLPREVEPDQFASSDGVNQPADGLSPSSDPPAAAESHPPANAPANRGSITKYLSSLWATASNIRPPV